MTVGMTRLKRVAKSVNSLLLIYRGKVIQHTLMLRCTAANKPTAQRMKDDEFGYAYAQRKRDSTKRTSKCERRNIEEKLKRHKNTKNTQKKDWGKSVNVIKSMNKKKLRPKSLKNSEAEETVK